VKTLSIAFKNIALVKEIESPENPAGLEKRVALTPEDVGQLTAAGVNVFVEQSVHPRKRGTARLAPGGPEVEVNDLALVAFQVELTDVVYFCLRRCDDQQQ